MFSWGIGVFDSIDDDLGDAVGMPLFDVFEEE